MKLSLRIFVLLLSTFSLFAEIDYREQREKVLDLGKLETVPKVYEASGFKSGPGIKAIFYDGLPYQGKSTRVFAYIGYPTEGNGSKRPAMVLVHGGGGTAFIDWVKEWTRRGYIAISIATEGQVDVKAKGAKWWNQHEWAGPKRDGIYHDHQLPLVDQWMYHAVADVVLAHNLLRADPKVDMDKIGVMGISWGGIITSTVMGIDTRFSLAIPTYGCGQLHVIDNQYGKSLGQQNFYKEVWNPMLRMERASMAALWFSWTGDTHFPLDVQSLNYFKAPGQRMVSYIPNMKHSHAAGWRPGDSYAFADSVFKHQQTWAEQKNLTVKQQDFEISFRCEKPVDKVTLYSTKDTGHTAKRKWISSPLKFDQQTNRVKIIGKLPDGTTAWFVNLNCGDLVVSSDFQDLR